ncbi:MAG: DUF362 domain-containing protein [Spirochaetota bacterium]|nr:DUF362 domain-containing protein [Spirochaetota bacterium]
MKVKVGLVKCSTYDSKELDKALEEAMRLSGGIDVKGKKLLLKPNILQDADPAKAISTHPDFVRAVIKYMKKEGATEIYVGDSPGFQKPGYSGRKSGIRQVCEETGAKWIDFTTGKTTIRTETGKLQKEFKVTSIINEVDMVISLPKMKTHQLMYFTGAVKNLFGLLPGLSKSPYHVTYPNRHNFGEMILDLLEAVKPSYSIMDAVIGMEGPGPGNGYPKPVKLIIASPNAVALDIIASTIIGYDPVMIPINRLGLKRNFGLKQISDISVEGLNISDVKIDDYKLLGEKKFQNIIFDLFHFRIFEKFQQKMKPKPYFIEEKCIKCGECIKICASNANWFEDGSNGKFVAVDYNKCIRCYCCHEVCPVDAIEIR